MRPNTLSLLIFLVIATLLTSCGPQGDIALQVTGKVTSEQGWTEDQVKAMEIIETTSTNQTGETKKYSGVPIRVLLDAAEMDPSASKVIFVADDGSKAEVDLVELNACPDCIISFRNQGGFSVVLPGFPGKMQMKGVIEV